MKKLIVYSLGGFFLLAGINHFVNPEFYLPLIPDYLPYPQFLNFISGALEVIASIGVCIERSRKYAAWLILALMILFIPSHVYFIHIGSCVGDGLCVPEWVAWVRLVVIHPLLIYWAWVVKDSRFTISN
ncbi:DoxX family protein [Mongoliitalea daihaiensis]|uniref:DoxX family protein n=1 Tax=Mongoliitalea daihaiensis TaxID=2782006 RepID=UPI001F31519F|nr:MauE/DoxX family redox-associated membrane protein [Mongoliitalea daihaiensis]UJP63557.1 DoxX family membrane protein [Mongoliitalea daihaiensis]